MRISKIEKIYLHIALIILIELSTNSHNFYMLKSIAYWGLFLFFADFSIISRAISSGSIYCYNFLLSVYLIKKILSKITAAKQNIKTAHSRNTNYILIIIFYKYFLKGFCFFLSILILLKKLKQKNYYLF